MSIIHFPRVVFAVAFNCILAILLLAPAAAGATPINYNLTLTPNAGSLYGGSGYFTVETPPAASGISDYKVGSGLDSLNISIDGQSFNLGMGTGSTLVRFLNGALNDITYSAATGTGTMRFAFQSTAGYIFNYNNLQSSSTGTSRQRSRPPPSRPSPPVSRCSAPACSAWLAWSAAASPALVQHFNATQPLWSLTP